MNPMMNPMSFNNDNGSGIPMFNKNGTALSNSERQNMAKKMGVCLGCGIKTHAAGFGYVKSPLTTQDIYKGICIRCNGGSVPPAVLNEWQARNQPSGSSAGNHGRFRTAAHVVRASHHVGMTRTLTPPLGSISARNVGMAGSLTPPAVTASAAASGSASTLSSSGGTGVLTAEVTVVRGPPQRNRESSIGSSHHIGSRTDSERSGSVAFSRTSDHRGPGMPSELSSRSFDRHTSFQQQLSGSSLSSGHVAGDGASVRQATSAPSTPTSSFGASTGTGGAGTGSDGAGRSHNSSLHHPHLLNGSSAAADPDEYRTSMESDSFQLIRDLQRNKDKHGILLSRLHGLRNLGEDDAGALHAIREVIETNFDNETTIGCRIVAMAIGAMWSICCKDDDKKKEAAETGCLNLVVDSMRVKNDPEIAQWALGALSSLALVEGNKRWIADTGGIEVMIQALDVHRSNPDVFHWASRALYVMITAREENYNEETKESLERNMTMLQESNGIKILALAMKHHLENDAAVAECWAMRVLHRLLDRASDEAANGVIRQFIDADLVPLCTSALTARGTTVGWFITASEMLSVLLETGASDLRGAAGDCINSVMRFMGEKSATIDAKASGARLLANLARGDNQTKRQISENSCLKMFVTTMGNKLDNLNFLQSTMMLLCTLSCDDSSFDFSLLGQIKSAIEKIDERYPDDFQLNTYICDFVANNGSIVQGQPDSVPINVALRIGNACTGASASNPQIGRALAMIFTQFPGASEAFIQGGGVERLLEGMCDSNADVQISSCVALSGIVSHSEAGLNMVLAGNGLEASTATLMVTESETLGGCVLELISAVVTSTSKKALQLPDEIILGILQGMAKFPSLRQAACRTIRNAMLVTVPGFNALNTHGLVETLLGVLDDHSISDDDVIEACEAVWAVCIKQPVSTDELAQLFASLLSLCALHKGGDDSPFNSAVLTAGAGALSGVVYSIRDNLIAIREDDIDLIVSILDHVIEHDVGNVVLIDRMLDVILTLCLFEKDLLIQFGVIVVVIDSMVEHEGNEEIQQKGCAILALLASTENLQVNLSIAETDGIDMIVSALAGFSENIHIQTDACRALSHLSIDHESRMLISSQGGLILLVNAMNRYQDETALLEAACSALLNISSDAEDEVIAGSNIVETVMAAMQSQVLSPRLQEKGLGVLQNISMRSKDAKRAIADAGGIGAVALTINEFMGSPGVIERAFTTMWSLAVLEDNQVRIADERGISLVVNGMMANIAHEKVQQQGCGCLCTLSSNSRNKTLIRELGGVDSIVYAMWAHYNSDSLLIEACRALSSLAVNVQTNEVMIATEGEISAIMAAMRRFPNSEKLQEHACVALRNFMLSSDNAALVRNQEAEVEELMNIAATRYPQRCADRARQVLQSIRG
jgi:hypothetical protein